MTDDETVFDQIPDALMPDGYEWSDEKEESE